MESETRASGRDGRTRPEPSAAELAELLVDPGESVVVPGSVEATVARAVAEAERAVPGCDRAAVVLCRRVGLELVSATDDETRDLVEYGTRGDLPSPFTQVVESCVPCLVADPSDDDRWPEWSARAAESVGAVSAYPLLENNTLLGVLAVFSAHRGAFTDTAVERGLIYARQVGSAVVAVRREVRLREMVAVRQTIGEAVGVLMEQHRLTTEQGFALLARASQGHDMNPAPDPGWEPEDETPPGPRLRIEPLGDGRTGLRLVGEVDVSNSDQVTAALAGLAASGADVHLELAGLGFIDVAGTRALLAAADRLHRRSGTRVVLLHPPATLPPILRLYGREWTGDPRHDHGDRPDADAPPVVTLPAAPERARR